MTQVKGRKTSQGRPSLSDTGGHQSHSVVNYPLKCLIIEKGNRRNAGRISDCTHRAGSQLVRPVCEVQEVVHEVDFL